MNEIGMLGDNPAIKEEGEDSPARPGCGGLCPKYTRKGLGVEIEWPDGDYVRGYFCPEYNLISESPFPNLRIGNSWIR